MLTYKLYQNKHKNTTGYGKWYARATQNEMYDLEKLSKHMSRHNTPYSAGTIKGIITDMVNCITELALDGKAVKIPNLGFFWIGIEGAPADSPAKWNVATGVKNVRLRCRPTGESRPIALNLERELREADTYSVEDGTEPSPTGGDAAGDGTDTGKSDGDNTGGTGYEVVDDGNG